MTLGANKVSRCLDLLHKLWRFHRCALKRLNKFSLLIILLPPFLTPENFPIIPGGVCLGSNLKCYNDIKKWTLYIENKNLKKKGKKKVRID